MDKKTKESTLTRPLFEKATRELSAMFDAGHIEDKNYASAILQAFTGHIKVLNSERATDALKFVIARNTASNSEEVKELIQKSLPEYVQA